MRILFAVGATGGHIYPAVAVAQELRKIYPEFEIRFVGPLKKLAAQIISKEGYCFTGIDSCPWNRSFNFWYLIKLCYNAIRSFIASFKYLLKIKPNIVIGFGSYACGPVLVASYLLGISTIIHEQNLSFGITNKILSYIAKKICLTYASKESLRNKKIVTTGNPVRSDLIISREQEQISEKLKLFNLKEDKFTILIFGGSQGSRTINKVVTQFLISKELNHYPFQMIFITGFGDFDQIKKEIEVAKDKVFLAPYVFDMASAYTVADVIICRSGASSISEITLCGIPAILIPYPYAAYNHQEENAYYLKKHQAAEVILEKDLNKEKLMNTLLDLYNNSDKLEIMRKNSKDLSNPSASKNIVEVIKSVINW
ncbi:MAG: undecaprenyldiphospho-muramoylpentapeptide beta-N-acetylglucosaminyltransferase [bacterium]|nr:undecaprenyldiphospho-muramoylpentapeptide beta-N-acetylglucosaminyltransferase [bacterium]